MKIVALSDIHGYLCPDIPECDVVCISGDILPLSVQRDAIRSVSWLTLDFKAWVEKLPCKKVVFIAGNHDFIFEAIGPKSNKGPTDVVNKLFSAKHMEGSKLVYLRDSEIVIDGVKFYGTPWVPNLYNWAFYASNAELVDIFNNIPKDTDILLSHCPPRFAELDLVLQSPHRNEGMKFGSKELTDAIRSKPSIKWCFSGHIHTGSHEPVKINQTNCVNVSIKDEDYKVSYKPFVIEV